MGLVSLLVVWTAVPKAVAVSIAVSPVDTNGGSALANAILDAGVTATNVRYTGANSQAGTFTGGTAAGLGFDAGIILTTGSAGNAGWPVLSHASTNLGSAGHAPLTTLAGRTTYDANVLTFDFVVGDGAAGKNVFFNFIFASEEYVGPDPEDIFGLNDAFAIYLNGVNVAMLPGTTTAVSVDNVNPTANEGFYVANPGGPGVVYDGFTTNIQVSLLALAAGPQTIEFAIADVGDGTYDSAVLIQAGSLSGVPEPSTLSLLAVGLGVVLRRRRRTV